MAINRVKTMKKHPFQRRLEKSNEKLKDTELGVYNQPKREGEDHRENHKTKKK